MRCFRISVPAVAIVFAVAGNVVAVPSNPFPGTLFDDDHTEIFHSDGEFFSLELFDFGDALSLDGNTFGFFFANSNINDPANLITIFGPEDVDPDPGGVGSIPQLAGVNLAGGYVVDIDASEIQSTFSGSGNIGFFLTVNPTGTGPLTLFSVNAFNPLFADVMGSFPFISDPNAYLLAFEEPFAGTLVGAQIVDNGVRPAPEPALCWLFVLGVAGVLLSRRNSKERRGTS